MCYVGVGVCYVGVEMHKWCVNGHISSLRDDLITGLASEKVCAIYNGSTHLAS